MINKTLEKAVAGALSALIALPLHQAPVWAAAAEAVAPAPASAASGKPAAELNAIYIGEDAVRIRLSAEAKHTSFVTAKPPRLIVQFEGVELATSAKLQPGQGKFLKSVRAGQFQRDPLIARVVLDLNEMTPFNIEKTGGDVVVTLGSVGANPQQAATAVSTPVAAATAKPARPKVSAPRAAAKPAAAASPEPAPSPAAPADESSADLTAARSELNRKVGEKDGMTTEHAPELALMAEKRDVANPAAIPAVADAAPTTSLSAVGKPRASRQDIMARLPGDPVSLDFDNTDIRDVLKLLAAKAKINIIYGGDVTGTVTLNLTDVPFNDAFRTILAMHGLSTTQVGDNILRVLTPAALQRSQTTQATVTKVIPLNYAKASEILATVNAVRSAEQRNGNAVVDLKTNSLIVTESVEGMVATERLIASLDVRPKQVLIEAKLIEVGLTNGLHYGIQWDYGSIDVGRAAGKYGTTTIGTNIGLPEQFSNPRQRSGLDTNSLEFPGFSTEGAVGAGGRGTGVNLPATQALGALTLGRITNNYFVSATLTAAASQGKVKVLSDPKIATLNNQPANINVTTSIPYVTSTVNQGVISNNVSYVVTGIQLQVTPSINADGRITLDISPRVSQPSATTAATTNAPAIDSRDARTTILVRDGETIVIGGLINDSVSNQIAKIPILGDIPILGWLFKKKSVIRTRAELLIFVTTRILPD